MSSIADPILLSVAAASVSAVASLVSAARAKREAGRVQAATAASAREIDLLAERLKQRVEQLSKADESDSDQQTERLKGYAEQLASIASELEEMEAGASERSTELSSER